MVPIILDSLQYYICSLHSNISFKSLCVQISLQQGEIERLERRQNRTKKKTDASDMSSLVEVEKITLPEVREARFIPCRVGLVCDRNKINN